jgi:hypothetical protein
MDPDQVRDPTLDPTPFFGEYKDEEKLFFLIFSSNLRAGPFFQP